MTSWQWALVLKPVVMPVLMALAVKPVVWVMYRWVPHGAAKVFLFRVRPEETRREKWAVAGWVLAAYAVLGCWVGFVLWLVA